MISGITVGLIVFISRAYKKFSNELQESDQSDAVSMVNTHLTQKTVYLGTVIIGLLALVFTEISSQMSFWWGIGNMVFGFGGIAIIVAIALIEDLESSLYSSFTSERRTPE